MELLKTLNNGYNKVNINNNIYLDKSINNQEKNNSKNLLNKSVSGDNPKYQKVFSNLIPEQVFIFTYINKMKNKYDNVINTNKINENSYNDNELINKILNLYEVNNKLEENINDLNNKITKLKEENEKILKLKNLFKEQLLKIINEDKELNSNAINYISQKNIEIKQLKSQIAQIEKLNKEKYKKYTQKIHSYLFENYLLKQEILQKNEEFCLIEKKLEITEKRVKEALFEIKNNKLKNSNKFSLLFGTKESEINTERKMISNEKRELILEKIGRQKGKDYTRKGGGNNSSEKNWVNSSIKDIGSTIFSSLNTVNNNNNNKIISFNNSNNNVNKEQKFEDKKI